MVAPVVKIHGLGIPDPPNGFPERSVAPVVTVAV